MQKGGCDKFLKICIFSFTNQLQSESCHSMKLYLSSGHFELNAIFGILAYKIFVKHNIYHVHHCVGKLVVFTGIWS